MNEKLVLWMVIFISNFICFWAGALISRYLIIGGK